MLHKHNIYLVTYNDIYLYILLYIYIHTHTHIYKALCCIPGPNITLQINYLSIKKLK